jgi:hypothetical protein
LVAFLVAIQACAPGGGLPSGVAGATTVPAGQAAGPSASTGEGASVPPATPVASPTPLSPVVGKWRLDRTCDAIVRALTDADLRSLLTRRQLRDMTARIITETIEGVPENGPLPSSWDPMHPCAHARPPTKHSHTFWADGSFNSYDENERQVDDGPYQIDAPDTLRMGDWTWTFHVSGDQLTLDPVLPAECGSPECLDGLGWALSVAYPGQRWTRETTGPHVPLGTESPS